MRVLHCPLKTSIFLVCAGFGTSACSFIVETEVDPDDQPGSTLSCSVDSDCSSLGSRFQCVRGGCFSPEGGCTRTQRVSTAIEEDQTWYPDTCYELAATIFVRNNAILTIRPGTKIVGLGTAAALIITRNGRILASGTEADPIVMTSAQPVGDRKPGDWGGLALLGNAPVNVGEDFLEGLQESPDTTYGRTVDPDEEWSCGILQYVRVEFAGFEFSNNNELNGLTLAGCGFDTQVEYVQVHYGSDDGIEIFGGNVGLQWIVISRAQDDALDWDQGWRGWAQFVAILQDEPRPDLNSNIYTGGDNGIEADSFSEIEPGNPRSRPRLFNFTMVGSQGVNARSRAMLLREGTSASLRNFLVMDYAQGLWDIRDISADCFRSPLGQSCPPTDRFTLDGILLYNMGSDGITYVLPEDLDNDNNFDEAAYITTTSTARTLLLQANDSPNLVQPRLSESSNIDLRPILGSAADISHLNPPAFADRPEQVQVSGQNYIGALEPGGQNWMAGWTSFPDN